MVGGRIGFAFLTFPTLGLPYPRGATQLQQIVPCAFPPDAAGPQPAALPRPASRQQKPPPRAVPSAPESSRNPAATDGDRRKGHPRPGRGQQLAPWRKRVAPHRLPCIHIYVCKAVCAVPRVFSTALAADPSPALDAPCAYRHPLLLDFCWIQGRTGRLSGAASAGGLLGEGALPVEALPHRAGRRTARSAGAVSLLSDTGALE